LENQQQEERERYDCGCCDGSEREGTAAASRFMVLVDDVGRLRMVFFGWLCGGGVVFFCTTILLWGSCVGVDTHDEREREREREALSLVPTAKESNVAALVER
jgi:hypothetical protein